MSNQERATQDGRMGRPLVWLMVLILLGVGAVAAYVLYGGSAPATDGAQNTAPGETQQGQVYTCSMHPEIRQPNPGKCPICGMELIPASRGHESDNTGRNER